VFHEVVRSLRKETYLFCNITMNILNLNDLIYSKLNLSMIPKNSTYRSNSRRGIIQGLHDINSPRVESDRIPQWKVTECHNAFVLK
jgi:hypothetical protein